jgi:hypothetical protein
MPRMHVKRVAKYMTMTGQLMEVNKNPMIEIILNPTGIPSTAHNLVSWPSGVIELSKLLSKVPTEMPPTK